MTTVRLNSQRAFWQSCTALRQQPLLVCFSLISLSTHLFGWALFAAADQVGSGVLAALLHLLGLVIYVGSLFWLIEGLTRTSLAQVQGEMMSWKSLSPLRCRDSRRLSLWFGTLLVVLGVIALCTVLLWSLLVLFLPALSVVPVLLGLITAAAVALSQIFGPCMVADTGLSGSALFRQGVLLLEHHWAGLVVLSCYLIGLVLLPFVVGLLAEALLEGLGSLATVLSLVVSLPLITTTVASAYWQLRPELTIPDSIRRSAR